MSNIQIFKDKQLIPVNENETGEVVLSGRELHQFLEVGTEYPKWFERMTDYGFVSNEDFIVQYYHKDFSEVKNDVAEKMSVNQRNAKGIIVDHVLKLDMAKEIAMIQRNEKGKQARQYFIQVEKAWNSPEMIMKRALEIANRNVESLKLENIENKKQLEEQKPKVIFADAVSASHTSILVGDLAKLLNQNGIKIGQNRLFDWLRNNDYLIKRKGVSYNMPTQYSTELGLFEIKETSISHSDGHISISKTPKVTGKGQVYFVNKFLQEQVEQEVACTS